MKKILFLLLVVASLHASAQVNTLYYMRNNPLRHELNPAFQPMSRSYVDLPIVPSIHLSAGNNSLSLKDVLYPRTIDGEKKYVFALHPTYGNKEALYNALRPNTTIYTDVRLEILSFGFRIKEKGYFTLGVAERLQSYTTLPREFMHFSLYGAKGEQIRAKDFSTNSQLFTEFAAGYSHKINEKVTVGGKFKFLVAQGNARLRFKNAVLDVESDKWTLTADGVLQTSIPGVNVDVDDKDNSINKITFDENKIKKFNQGLGASIDLGVTYRPVERLQLSFSLLDVGFVHWRDCTVQLPVKGTYVLDDIDEHNNKEWYEQLADQMKECYSAYYNKKNYTTELAGKALVGVECSVAHNKISFGALSKTTLYNHHIYEDVTLSANFFPIKWFNATVSYSLLHGHYSDIGFGLGVRAGIFYLYAAADYIPFNYTTQGIPYKSREVNASVGILLAFGNRTAEEKDRDGDGVRNRKDRCPNTPKGVEVDKHGCPVDTTTVAKQDTVAQEQMLVEIDTIPVVPIVAVDSVDSVLVIEDTIPVVQPITKDTIALEEEQQIEQDTLPVVKKEVRQLFQEALQGIEFATGEAEILPSSYELLDKIVKILNDNPQYILRIAGHTDNIGTFESNEKLSYDRAQAVASYLMDKGIDFRRLVVKGFGQTLPVATNDTPEGRAKNRRVEFTVIGERSVFE